MAQVIITATDNADGTVSLKIESEPAFPGPAAKDPAHTAAQYLGLIGMEAMMKAAGGESAEDD